MLQKFITKLLVHILQSLLNSNMALHKCLRLISFIWQSEHMAILTKLTIEFCRIKVVKRIIHVLLILSRETNLYPVVNIFPYRNLLHSETICFWDSVPYKMFINWIYTTSLLVVTDTQSKRPLRSSYPKGGVTLGISASPTSIVNMRVLHFARRVLV